jgi:uncharacterized protein (TIGR02231 family)
MLNSAMQKTLLTILCLAWVTTRAGDSLSTAAVLKSVMVYRSGAELIHSASATLPAGSVELAIDRVSNDMDLNSVQIHLPASVTLLGFSYLADFLTVQPKTARQQQLEDSLDRLNDSQDKVQLALTNTNDLLEVLKNNRELKGAQTGMNIADLVKLMDYYKTKSAELTDQQYQLKKRSGRIGENIARIKAQIEEEQTLNTKESGRLILRLSVTDPGTYPFTLSYLTRNAGWTPTYEIQVKDGRDSVKVVCKAGIRQSTGLDWRQVKMALSTSTPSVWNEAPGLDPWFVAFQPPPSSVGAFALRGVSTTLDEVVVTGYGAKKFKSADANAPAEDKAKTLSDYTVVTEQRLNTVYTIDLPYDLPSNGKEQTVAIQTKDVAASFKYLAVPKISNDVYLLADIPDCGKLDLLSGQANIVLNGTYVGLTSIDPTSAQDTLHLTVGQDKRITLDRHKVSDISSEKFLNANQQRKYAYEITVRNNKNQSIHLTLLDQVPVSTNKDIEVTPTYDDKAFLESAKGELKWTLDLASGASQKVHFGYTLKYPKDQNITMR